MRAWLVAIPPALVALWLAWIIADGDRTPALAALGLALLLSAIAVAILERRLARRLRTGSAVLASFREGDFSVRARIDPLGQRLGSPLEDVLNEVNQLGDALREHRLGEMEAWALLRNLMSEVDVLVLAFEDRGRLRLANEAAAKALGRPAAALIGEDAAALGLAALLSGEAPRIVRDALPLGAGPFELRRGAFRLSGEPHTLLVLSDLSRTLRDSEREAWRRLIRVMGHEINNSLAPIRSLSESLAALLRAVPRPPDWEEDLNQGLSVIARRSEALGRFLSSYAALARLPAPKLERVSLAPLIEKVARLEQRRAIVVSPGPALELSADADQLEQALINLLKNAVEAVLDREGAGVRLRWTSDARWVAVAIEDDGPGVSDTANLFVPFFTTKTDGSGIGLVLSRQIVEAHGGTLSLATRPDGKGAIAILRLPLI